MNESKYVMAIIKIPVEIFSNGHTVTYDDKTEMDFQEIDRLPDDNQNKSLNIFDKLFSNLNTQCNVIKHNIENQDPPVIEEENQMANAIQQILKNQIFVKKEEIKKKNRKFNTTFKNKKSKTQRITQKVYSTLNSDNDQDVDLVQSPMDQELQQEDDQ